MLRTSDDLGMKNSIDPCDVQVVFCDIMTSAQYLEIESMFNVPILRLGELLN